MPLPLNDIKKLITESIPDASIEIKIWPATTTTIPR